MYVYLIAAPAAGLVKIGYSCVPRERLANLRTASPVQLELLGFFKGRLEDEQALHARFKGQWSHLEWFRDCKDIRDTFASQPSWQGASEVLPEFAQESITASPTDGIDRGSLKDTVLYATTLKIIDRWLNAPVRKDCVAQSHTATRAPE